MTEETLFVLINNTYPFPYDIVKYVTEEPFPFFAKDKINTYERFNSKITTDVVEKLKEIVAEHELRISVNKFNGAVNPVDVARMVAKIAGKTIAGASDIWSRIVAKLILKLDPLGSLFKYQLLQESNQDVVDALTDVVNEERVIQVDTNAGFTASILTQVQETKFLFACLASLTGITAFDTALSAGNTLTDVVNYFNTNKVKITENEIRVLAVPRG